MSKELIIKFVTHLEQSGKSNSTVIAYKKDLHQLWEQAGKDLHQLSAVDINGAMVQMQEKLAFTPKTVSRKINSFRTFFRFLQDNQHIANNPAEQVEHPKLKSKPPRVLAPMEYLALREVSRTNKRLYSMIELLLQTGIRIGELSRLQVNHVRLDEDLNHLHIEPYSTIPVRRIPFTNRVKQLIQEYLVELEYDTDNHPLFPTREGKHIIIRNIRSSIDRAMLKAGIEAACVNDLRNTFIAHQLKAGVPIELVSEVVGHKSKNTTAKYIDLLGIEYKPTGENKLVEL